nr:MAG TPA: hypothetical protein [Caudoviricetes sp.]
MRKSFRLKSVEHLDLRIIKPTRQTVGKNRTVKSRA